MHHQKTHWKIEKVQTNQILLHWIYVLFWYFPVSASGAYGKIKDCATRNQYEQVYHQAEKGARFFDIDTRVIGNRVDTCHGVAHEVELSKVNRCYFETKN